MINILPSVVQIARDKDLKGGKKDHTRKFDSFPFATEQQLLQWLVEIRQYTPEAAQNILGQCQPARFLKSGYRFKVDGRWRRLNCLAFPIYDIDNPEKVIGYQRITITEKHQPRINSNGSNKGFLPFIVDGGPIIFVESVVNALLLAAYGFNAICIFSCSFVGSIPRIMELYQRKFYVWLDRGAERQQSEAIELCPELRGVSFSEALASGYDVDDLFREMYSSPPVEGIASEVLFVEEVKGYLLDADRPRSVREFEEARRRELVYDEVGEALEKILGSKKKNWFLRAPCGSGKTTIAQMIAVDRVRRGKFFVYVANQKKDMYQFDDGLRELLGDEYEKNVAIVSMDEQTLIGEDKKIIITHKTYFSRKGESTLHYYLLW